MFAFGTARLGRGEGREGKGGKFITDWHAVKGARVYSPTVLRCSLSHSPGITVGDLGDHALSRLFPFDITSARPPPPPPPSLSLSLSLSLSTHLPPSLSHTHTHTHTHTISIQNDCFIYVHTVYANAVDGLVYQAQAHKTVSADLSQRYTAFCRDVHQTPKTITQTKTNTQTSSTSWMKLSCGTETVI